MANLNQYLNKSQLEAGLTLSDNGTCLTLSHGKHTIAEFSHNIEIERVHDVANTYLAGISFEKV